MELVRIPLFVSEGGIQRIDKKRLCVKYFVVCIKHTNISTNPCSEYCPCHCHHSCHHHNRHSPHPHPMSRVCFGRFFLHVHRCGPTILSEHFRVGKEKQRGCLCTGERETVNTASRVTVTASETLNPWVPGSPGSTSPARQSCRGRICRTRAETWRRTQRGIAGSSKEPTLPIPELLKLQKSQRK